jgi:hypothetical protein
MTKLTHADLDRFERWNQRLLDLEYGWMEFPVDDLKELIRLARLGLEHEIACGGDYSEDWFKRQRKKLYGDE